MKKIGMIGGFGPESTIDYYKHITQLYRETVDSGSYPEIIINSMDIHKLFSLITNKLWNDLVMWLVEGVKVLHEAGADFGFISANTPHIVFDEVQEMSPIPLISIVEETCKKVLALNIECVGLLGTQFTMQNSFYQKVFDKKDITIILPKKHEQDYIQHKLMSEIEVGIFSEDTKYYLLRIIERMMSENKIKGLILGCTELPLILTKDEFDIPFINTTKVHVESILRYYNKCDRINISKSPSI